MHTIYRIPGLGLDKRVFSRLEFSGNYRIVDLEWEYHPELKSLDDYARFLSRKIDNSQTYSLLGLSMGGMVVVEMLKYLNPEKAVIISSAKSRNELPLKARILGNIGLHHLVPSATMVFIAVKMVELLVPLPDRQKRTVIDMLKSGDEKMFKWSLNAIVNWQNKDVPRGLIHIHGDADRTLPFMYIGPPVKVIEGGTHFMAGNRAGEINKILDDIFK